MLSFTRMSDLTLYLYASYESNALYCSNSFHALRGAFCSTVAAVVRALRASLSERLLPAATRGGDGHRSPLGHVQPALLTTISTRTVYMRLIVACAPLFIIRKPSPQPQRAYITTITDRSSLSPRRCVRSLMLLPTNGQ